MIFKTYGPFKIPKTSSGRLIDDTALEAFWNDSVGGEHTGHIGLPDAVGCYIFSIRKRGGGPRPWYVGMTEKQKFRNECFCYDKWKHFNKALDENRGTPFLTLIAKHTENGRFSRPSKNEHKDIQFLETYLIGLAIRCNPELKNKKHTKFLREMRVPGILNTPAGHPTIPVSKLMELLKLNRRS